MEIFDGVSEGVLRFTIFASVLVLMASLEFIVPRRTLTAPKIKRWATNFLIVGIDTAFVRAMGALAIPLAAVATAIWAEGAGWGLFNLTGWPLWLEVILAIIILDFAIWLQHVASHKIPALWRLHQMHHADIDIDVSTAIRFHPFEIALSMIWKIVCVLALGPAALAVVLFEVLLNASAMFNHANIKLPIWLDSALRRVIVTPDMHRIHHSVVRREHDTNYGFALSIWDRWLGTYTAEPAGGQTGMTIGLPDYQSPEPTKLLWSLTLPFRRLAKGDGARDS
ncbi:MAG: sterol desaturase family protein [Pseudomonadota bacterium]